jgi:hypothetical protein
MSATETETSKPRMIWKSSGLHLTKKQKNGWLEVTPDLLRAYYTRPEVHPVEESCPQEHLLFERLMNDPVADVANEEIAKIADPDAAENYRIILRFRDHLVRHATIEQAYMALFTSEKPPLVPPVFIEQMVHLILSGMLSNTFDPFVVRAAEIFFRDQKVTTEGGQIMFADSEVVEVYSETGGMGGLGGLLAESGTQMREVSLDVLTEDNQTLYWDRADQFNFALDFRYTQPGPDAFARVLERWIRHMLGVDTKITAVQSVSDQKWSWHVGLDQHATQILNDLYNGKADPMASTDSIAGLFRLEFTNRTDVVDEMRGKAVYLGLAMSPDNVIVVKPQNLLVNLPLRKKN